MTKAKQATDKDKQANSSADAELVVKKGSTNDTDIIGIISIVMIVIFPLIGLILGIIGVYAAKAEGRSTTLSRIGAIVNGVVVGLAVVLFILIMGMSLAI